MSCPQHSAEHYAAVAALLLAGDVQSRVVNNEAYMGIEVKREGLRIVWGNGEKEWGWTTVDTEGRFTSGQSAIPSDATPEEVAKGIATEAYETNEVYDSAAQSTTA